MLSHESTCRSLERTRRRTPWPFDDLRREAIGFLTIDGATFGRVPSGAPERFSDALMQLTATLSPRRGAYGDRARVRIAGSPRPSPAPRA
jgi:hypothetical protein